MYQAKRILVTSALPYANGPLHIGHLAGAYLSADVYVRFNRMYGKNIKYICGSDEHGAAITIKALKEGISPKEIIDKYHSLFLESFKAMGIDFDFYHRTSEKIHHETSQDIFRELYKKKVFVLKENKQYYDEEAKQFLADRYIVGTCPNCTYKNAYGDQCENCGSSLSPLELIDPKSTLNGSKPTLRKTAHWYLPLNKAEKWLKEWVDKGILHGYEHHDPKTWKKHVIGQCKSWLNSGLEPRAMTRDLDWGVDVPQEIPGSKGKKLYVWMDAPIGYISATKAWAQANNEDWKTYWKDGDTALIHFIGKDNIVFHCLIFPAILNELDNFILPVNIPANQFLNLEGQKISTSRNWAVWVHEYVKDMPEYIDELRYYMIKNMPEQKDAEFTWKGFQDSTNNELVNNLANFINRVIVLTHKYYDGITPNFDPNILFTSAEDEDQAGFHDSEMLYLFDLIYEVETALREFDFKTGLKHVMKLSAAGNALLQFNEPWKLIKEKDRQETVKTIINLGLQYVSVLSIIMKPFMPHKSDDLRAMLNLKPIDRFEDIWSSTMDELSEGELIIQPGHRINKAQHLFTKIYDDKIQAQIDKLKATSKNGKHVEQGPIKNSIKFEDFNKLDIRTATIIDASFIPKANKLLKIQLDLGFETRTVVSGIAEQFKPEDIIGKRVSIIANLQPKKIRGIKSNGMILMAEDQDGKLGFVSPDEGIYNGSKIT